MKKIYFSLLISYALPFFFSWLFRDSEESMFVYLCAMLIIRMCIVWCSICAYSTKNVKRQIKQNKIYDIPYAISNSVWRAFLCHKPNYLTHFSVECMYLWYFSLLYNIIEKQAIFWYFVLCAIQWKPELIRTVINVLVDCYVNSMAL